MKNKKLFTGDKRNDRMLRLSEAFKKYSASHRAYRGKLDGYKIEEPKYDVVVHCGSHCEFLGRRD